MKVRVRLEEYAPLGRFMMASFVRDLPLIEARFKKYNAAYVANFQNLIDAIETLEGTLTLSEEQYKVTESLNIEVEAFDKELNFLSAYFKDAGFSTDAITVLKNSLKSGNVEGALLELKSMTQFAAGNKAILEEQGMSLTYIDELEATYTSISAKNVMQYKIMKEKEALVEANKAAYKNLYACIAGVAEKGKLVFSNSNKADEYTITKIIGRMRSPKKKKKK